MGNTFAVIQPAFVTPLATTPKGETSHGRRNIDPGLDKLRPGERGEPFEALMTLALSIEEEDQAMHDDQEKSSERGEHTSLTKLHRLFTIGPDGVSNKEESSDEPS